MTSGIALLAAAGGSPSAERRSLRVVAPALLLVALFAVLAALDVAGAGTAWTRAHIAVAFGAALTLALTGSGEAEGRERRVRSWTALGIAIFLAAEVLRDVESIAGWHLAIDPADAALPALVAVVLFGYRAAFAERLRGAEALAAYLDGGTVFFIVGAVLLLVFGPTALATAGGPLLLGYAIFFLATAGATWMLALVMRVERRPGGTVAVLVALALLGVSYLGRLAAGVDVGDRSDVGTNALLSIAALVGGHGAATWRDARDEDPAYERFAGRARAAIPLAAAALAPTILLLNRAPAGFGSDPLALLTAVAVGLVLMTVMVRQSMLLRDRQAAVEREQRLTAELRAAEESYRSMVELVPAVIYVAELGVEGRWQYVSPRIESLLGFGADEWMADPGLWMRQIHPEDRDRVVAEEAEHGEHPGDASASEYRIFRRDGTEIWVRDEAVIVRDPDGRPGWWRGVIVDITDRRRAEDALRDSEEQMRLIIDTASQAYIRMDADGLVSEWNQQAERTFGWPRDEVIGRPLAELIIPAEQRQAHEAGVRRYLEGGEATMLGKRVEVNALHRSGRQFPAELTIWAVRTAGGVQFSALVHDITVRKELETQLQHQAFHDALTGLANRALFVDRVTHALARLERRPRTSLAVLFLDLDDFKTINDTLGHVAGDQVLAAVAERMRAALRPEDTAARFGGDEFAVLIEETSRTGARRAADRLLQALRSPFDLQGRQVVMRGSIGIALSDGESASPDDLLRHADLAMYTAKGRGKGRIEFFEPEMHLAVVRRLELRSDLEQAIVSGELELHYQPIVNLRDGRLSALEALVRWRHPTQGLVEPADFIPAAEENGLILPLGRWVVQAACAQLAAWDRDVPPRDPDRPTGITVNVSTRQLADPQLAQTIVGALTANQLDPGRLTLEITESALMEDIDACAAMLRGLKRLGVRLAIDDFGTGYSALSYLERLPIDLLKIDGSFTSALGPGSEVPVLVRSIIKLGQTLRMEVLAEGIERPEQLARLRQLGCRLGQGYLFARPMPAAEAAALLEHRWPEALTA